MRHFLILLSIILFSVPAFADKASVIALNLLNKNGVYVYDSDILSFLHQLAGDTITFNVSSVNDLSMFSKEQSDTIWGQRIFSVGGDMSEYSVIFAK